MPKQCKKCELTKSTTEFNKRSSSRDGLDIYCKLCKTNYTNKWKLDNPEKLKQSKKLADANWYQQNKKKKKAINKKWKESNADYSRKWFREYKQKREAVDPNFKLANKLRTRLWYALNGQKPRCSFDEYTGCSLEELRLYLESKFEPGMTWENYGEWEIDHIVPLCQFILTELEELKQACKYTNLQPIWKKKHKIKTKKDLQLRKKLS